MKKFSKLFLSCAAVAAVTAAVATSAMAAGEISATYTAAGENETTAKLTIDASGYTADQKTLLIVPSSVSLDKVSGVDVVQIDQNAEIVDVVLPADLKDGKYTVYMGGDGKVYSTEFKVGNASSILVGNVNFDEDIDLSDATAIVRHFTKISPVTGDALTAADVNYDDVVDLSDATCVVRYFVKLPGSGHAGETK